MSLTYPHRRFLLLILAALVEFCTIIFLNEFVRTILGSAQDQFWWGATINKNHLNQNGRPKCWSECSLAINCPLGAWACQPPVIRGSRFPWIPHPGYRYNDNSSETLCTNMMAWSSVEVSLISYQREAGFYEQLPNPALIKEQKGMSKWNCGRQ